MRALVGALRVLEALGEELALPEFTFALPELTWGPPGSSCFSDTQPSHYCMFSDTFLASSEHWFACFRCVCWLVLEPLGEELPLSEFTFAFSELTSRKAADEAAEASKIGPRRLQNRAPEG